MVRTGLQSLLTDVKNSVNNESKGAWTRLSLGDKLIFLDILLDGPDGFTLLNELASYPDTCKIPIVIVSSLYLKESDLSSYNVVGILSKDSMTPGDILSYAEEYGS